MPPIDGVQIGICVGFLATIILLIVILWWPRRDARRQRSGPPGTDTCVAAPDTGSFIAASVSPTDNFLPSDQADELPEEKSMDAEDRLKVTLRPTLDANASAGGVSRHSAEQYFRTTMSKRGELLDLNATQSEHEPVYLGSGAGSGVGSTTTAY